MSTLIIAPSLSMGERLKHRRNISRMQEFQVLGKLLKILFEWRGMDLPATEYPVFQQNLIDWYDKDVWLAASLDGQDLLINPGHPFAPIPHPPDIPDTRTIPATMRPQRYSDRTTAKFHDFCVIRPVQQIIFKPKGKATYANINVGAGHDGSQMAFLIDPQTGEGHLVGGSFQISVL